MLCGNYKDFVWKLSHSASFVFRQESRALEINLCQFSTRRKSNNQSGLQYDNSGICIAHYVNVFLLKRGFEDSLSSLGKVSHHAVYAKKRKPDIFDPM